MNHARFGHLTGHSWQVIRIFEFVCCEKHEEKDRFVEHNGRRQGSTPGCLVGPKNPGGILLGHE